MAELTPVEIKINRRGSMAGCYMGEEADVTISRRSSMAGCYMGEPEIDDAHRTFRDSLRASSQTESIPYGVPIYRRDDKDRQEMLLVIEREILSLIYSGETTGKSLEEVEKHMSSFKKGVWEAYKALNSLMKEEGLAYNKKLVQDPDHWFEINTANAVLFNYLSLQGLEQVLPGRLFTTRMPRNISIDPEAAAAFEQKVREHDLHTVLVLAESKEYQKYAGADLEAFYRSIGLNIIHRPMPDFSIPKETDMLADIKDLTKLLSDGKNCLVHCAGGNGRTGTVIAGIMKNVGVRAPVSWIRRVKTAYVETAEQEKFINEHIPISIDDEISMKHPLLAKAIAAEHILEVVASGQRKRAESDPVAASGWLTKRGHVVATWKRRWFVLETLPDLGAQLTYYEDDSKQNKKGEYTLSPGSFKVEESPDSSHVGQTFVFKLTFTDGSEGLFMSAFSGETRDKWVDKIRELGNSTRQGVSGAGRDFGTVFSLLDENDSGEISLDELSSLFQQLGASVPDSQIRTFLSSETGSLTKDDFIAIMEQSTA